MKIVSIGNFEAPTWDGSISDENHIADALEGLGHKIIRKQRNDFKQEDIYKMPDIIEGVTFVLIAQWDWYHEDLKNILNNVYPGAKTVYWAFDHQADNQDWHQRLIAGVDLYLSKMLSDSKYPHWRWLAQDFAPEFLDKWPGDQEKDIDVLFTGTYLPFAGERIELLKAIDERFNLEVYSTTPDQWKEIGLKNVHGAVLDEGLRSLINRAKVNISVDIHTETPGYWSDRNAQIMACAGFVLFKYTPMSEARFGSHLEYFNSVEECLEKIQFYLDNTALREAVAEYGYRFAQDSMKVSHRVFDLITIVRSVL